MSIKTCKMVLEIEPKTKREGREEVSPSKKKEFPG
jgi:hypothetical protein